MFGTNAITKQFLSDDGSLLVNEVFPTIQGEGPDSGTPALFIRLSKCNLRCYFCDTEFEKGELRSQAELIGKCAEYSKPFGGRGLVVLTGGEPLLQNVVPFVEAVNKIGMAVSIETAGTVYVPGLETLFKPDRSIAGNLIVCSPKTPVISAMLRPLIGAFKYVTFADRYDHKDGLPTFSTQREGEPMKIARPTPGSFVFLSPADEGDEEKNKANRGVAAWLCMKYRYTLSLQIHKILNLP